MARVLIVGCGCRGRSLAGELIAAGHAVRGTTRDPARAAEIEAIGAEAVVGDPDVIATLARSLDHVSVACVLLGSAGGSAEGLAALHGTRLEMLLTRMLDTTVRGIVYEATGSVDRALLDAGVELVRERCEDSRIPFALLDADPGDWSGWTSAAVRGVESVLVRR
ncbi:MAG TPA: NAD-binding protein [Solirubrobacteraceae bacterium]|jgi:nucleoside-diphosphate-sugar epimerase